MSRQLTLLGIPAPAMSSRNADLHEIDRVLAPRPITIREASVLLEGAIDQCAQPDVRDALIEFRDRFFAPLRARARRAPRAPQAPKKGTT
jgi:hypothetical protein